MDSSHIRLYGYGSPSSKRHNAHSVAVAKATVVYTRHSHLVYLARKLNTPSAVLCAVFAEQSFSATSTQHHTYSYGNVYKKVYVFPYHATVINKKQIIPQ